MAWSNLVTFTFAADGLSPTFGVVGPVALTAQWGTGVSAGAITLEVASGGDFAGTWKTELGATLTYSAGSPVAQASLTDTPGPVARVRCASLAGGTVTVTMRMQIKSVY